MKDEEKRIQDEHEPEPEVDTDAGDDFVFEENSEVTGGDAQAKVQKLKARIKELEKKNSELLDGWQRDKADFVNLRKRDEQEKKEFVKFAKEDIIAELLPILDSFESAMKNKEAWEKVEKNWRIGVEYINSQLLNVLSQHGLKVINPVGEKFNVMRDDAIENVPVTDEAEEGKIVEVVQVGYELQGKEIRAPKVKVAHFEK
jgi:molecular chaperone GrpE